jgi:hypothetical protein
MDGSRLRWACEICGNDVEDGTGYAAIEDTAWQVVHEHCDPASARRSFRVQIADLRTARSTLKVTAYLLGELDWAKITDWSRLLLNAASQLP